MAIPTERDRPNGEPSSLLDAAGGLTSLAAELLGRPEQLRRRAAAQIDAADQAETARRLEALPVGSLREAAGRGTRIAALERAGVRSAADVLRAGPRRLTTLPGIGEATADQVFRAATLARDAVRAEARFRLDPDRRNQEQTGVLATLTAIRDADVAVAGMRADIDRLMDRVVPLADAGRPAVSFWSRLLSRSSTRRRAYAALAELEHVLAEPSVHALRAEMLRRTQYTDPSPEELWTRFRADAAAITSLLSTLGVGPVDEAASQGFVPDEIGHRVAATALDLSRMRPSTVLRGYQAFGARYALQRGRAIIGDEMGLGKTLQALAVVAHLAADGPGHFLVVCPASVQVNWLNEIDRHTDIAGHNLHGRDRAEVGERWIRDGGVGVTTYDTLARLPEPVRRMRTALLVLDEAHLVKNPETARSRTVTAAIGRSGRTLLLTGTPMENRVEEFRTLVAYLNRRVAERIDARDALGGARRFRRAVADIYLRRNQDDVLTELPERIETESWVLPSRDDAVAYRRAVESGGLMAMRRAALSSYGSAKLERLREIVDEAAQDGHKVLVFSTFLDVLGLVQGEVPGVAGRIDGSVPPAVRQRVIDDFTAQTGHAVLVSQIDAGGTGLNIQAASVVVLTEPQWKPSTEEQAIARAHRMGQTRPVQVHRLLAKDTVDERIREIQQGKRLLFDAYARRSDAKDADRAAVDTAAHRPAVLDDPSVPEGQRVMLAERHRLGFQ